MVAGKERSSGLARGALIAANSLTAAATVGTVSVGVWTLASQSFLTPLVPDNLFLSSAYIQVVASLFCLGNCAFGCYAALKEVKVLVAVHSALSSLLLTVLLVAGLIALVFRGQVGSSFKAQLFRDIRRYEPGSTTSQVTRAWDSAHTRLQCCGVATLKTHQPWQSWADNPLLNPGPEKGGPQLPLSCCPTGVQCSGATAWPSDCYTLALLFLRSHSITLAASAWITAGTLTLTIICSVMLFQKLA